MPKYYTAVHIVNEPFSGHQPCFSLEITTGSMTISAPIIRAMTSLTS